MRCVPATWTLAIAVLWFSGSVSVADLYKWTDKEGVLHVATSLGDVPEQYRDQVVTMKGDSTPAASRQPTVDTPPTAQSLLSSVDELPLARFEVPYENEGSARRIIIPVKFNDSVTAPMALDTGSPGMVISVDLAVTLRVFSRDNGTLLTEAAGIGGKTLAVLTIIDSVAVEGARTTFVPTTVTASISPHFEGLIGMDFLANYTLSIDSRKRVIVFQETPPQPEARGGHDEDWWRTTFEDFRSIRDGWAEHARSANLRPESQAASFIDFQVRESQRLLQRLHIYASDNAVPQHWR